MSNLQPKVSYTYHPNGNIKTEEWKLNGKYHNPNGPAVKTWDDNNQLIRESYWINGVEVDKSAIKKMCDNPISSSINNDLQVNPPC